MQTTSEETNKGHTNLPSIEAIDPGAANTRSIPDLIAYALHYNH